MISNFHRLELKQDLLKQSLIQSWQLSNTAVVPVLAQHCYHNHAGFRDQYGKREVGGGLSINI